MATHFDWSLLHSPAQWLRYWGLRKELARHQEWANGKLALSVQAPAQQPDGVLTEQNRLHWAKHYLSKGADPNARAKSSVVIEEDVGRYSSLKGARSILSLSLLYPTICKALVEAGAVFDRSAMEYALYIINLEQWNKRHDPKKSWDMSDVAASIEAMFASSKISAKLHCRYVDLSDMQIKPAYQIMARLYPAASAFAEEMLLQKKHKGSRARSSSSAALMFHASP
jgi:hypothetical protein